MRALFAIRGADGVAILVLNHIFSTKVEHGLNGDNHTGHKFIPGAPFAEIRDIRVFVYRPPNAMPGENFHNAVIVFLPGANEALYRITDIPHGIAIESFVRSRKENNYGIVE